MKKFNFKRVLGVGAAVAAVGAVNANAALDTSGVSFNTDDAVAVAGLVLAAVAVLWGVRKAISMGNKG